MAATPVVAGLRARGRWASGEATTRWRRPPRRRRHCGRWCRCPRSPGPGHRPLGAGDASGFPALGMVVPSGLLGLQADGTVEVPSAPRSPGGSTWDPLPASWGRRSSSATWTATSAQGCSSQLRTLAAGDQVDVDLADGDTAQFTVNTVAAVPEAASSRPSGSMDRTARVPSSWSPVAGSSTTRPAATSPTSWSTLPDRRHAHPVGRRARDAGGGGPARRPGGVRTVRSRRSAARGLRAGASWRRSFDAHSALAALERRSLAAGLKRCSAPCGVIPPTASPISRQLAPTARADSAAEWLRRSAARRKASANRSSASGVPSPGHVVDGLDGTRLHAVGRPGSPHSRHASPPYLC